MIAQRWAVVVSQKTYESPSPGRWVQGLYPICHMAVVGGVVAVVDSPMHPLGGEERSGGVWKTQEGHPSREERSEPPPPP